MSKLVERQEQFCRCDALLVTFAFEQEGVTLTIADGYRDPRVFGEFGEKKGYGSKNSVHKLRLAKDYNLRINGVLIENSGHKMWCILHKFWESLGGACRISADSGHFSFSWGDYR